MSNISRGFANRRMRQTNDRPICPPDSLKAAALQIEEETRSELPSIRKEERSLPRRSLKNQGSEIANRLGIRNNPIRSLSENPKTKGKLGEMEALISSQINENPSDPFSAYALVLNKIAQEDKVFGKLIFKIKCFFDNEISTSKPQQLAKDKKELRAEILKGNENIEEQINELKTISETNEKFRNQNKNFKKTLEEKKDQLENLKLEVKKIQRIDLSEMERDPEVWEYILKTNQFYLDKCKKLKKENKELMQKERKLTKILNSMLKQDVNVEEIFGTKEHSQEKRTQRVLDEKNSFNQLINNQSKI